MQETVNGHVPLSTPEQNRGSAVRTKMSATRNPKDYDFRYMYEKMMERSEGPSRSLHRSELESRC